MSEQAVDLVILDMVMEPGINGLETYRKILELFPKQKAIVATGFSETKMVREIKKLGVNICLNKPYEIRELCNAVRKELDRI